MQADYAQSYRTLWDRHWWWRSREAYVVDRLERVCQRAGGTALRILDVGCGDGLFFDRLERFGAVEGLEPDGSLVVDPRWRDRIQIGRLDDLPSAPRYDLVLMLDVLEHIADDLDALRRVRGILRPGGTLVLTVPAVGWLWSRHDEVNEHHRRYDRRGLRSVLEAAGFGPLEIGYFFAWTVGPLAVRRWLHPAGGGGRRARLDYTVKVPPAPVNRALAALSRAERFVGRVVRWPLGSSLLAVAVAPPRT